MAGILNINSTNNVNSKKIYSKLNFEVGQVFVAKMIKVNDNSTVLLRMSNGWQFSAQIPKQSQINIEGLTRFSVAGIEDGELLLKVENNNTNIDKKNNDPVENLINSEESGVNKDDYNLLKDMIKHNLPLSSENISKVKVIIDFINKTQGSNNIEDGFVDKYMESKNISQASSDGKSLKDFFGQLKGLKTDDILTLLENGVELNEKNLKSYNNIFKGNGTLYKDIQNIKADISKLNVPVLDTKEMSEIPIKQIAASVQNINETIATKIEQEIDLLDTAGIIKDQISVKTQDMKTVIKTLLEVTSNAGTESYDKIIDTIKNNISDFKVFNSVSNQYYYLDIPITKNNYEHQLKLIIKDQRGKGKKIDTSNCKIAASISTRTLNVVDAYIKINNRSMEIDLKCFKPFIESVNKNKENLLNELVGIGYNVYVNVNEKQQELNLANCSSFFEDDYFSNIDVKV